MTSNSLTQSQLKELLSYCPETGIFTWNISTNIKTIGAVASKAHKTPNGKAYGWICVYGKNYLAHRLVWLYIHGSFPLDEIDHIDGDGTNNRISNLRSVTSDENRKNRRKPRNNTAGVVGVYWDRYMEKWYVQLSICGKNKHFGTYKDKFDAICARKSAEHKHGYHKNHGSNRPL